MPRHIQLRVAFSSAIDLEPKTPAAGCVSVLDQVDFRFMVDINLWRFCLLPSVCPFPHLSHAQWY